MDARRRRAPSLRGGPVTRLTAKGPRDLDALLRELAQARRRGYSVDDEGVREGVYSFGAPVFGASGEAVAAISVCINKAQLGADRGSRHRDLALAVAADLSRRIGGDVRPARRLQEAVA